MHLSSQNDFLSKNSSSLINPAMFSLVEFDSHYMVAVDLPTIPMSQPEILKTKNQLTVESHSDNPEKDQTILRLLQKGSGIKSIYKDGVLWLVLPKVTIEQPLLKIANA
ncbi:MAG: hypothetical protein AB7O96_15885 [Pseudobdellovibrionaceae bacterium]